MKYHKPETLAEAVADLKADDEAKPLSGGQTLLPTIKQRLADPSVLIDVRGLPGMVGISREGDTLVIGAGTTHAAVASDAAVNAAIPGLARLAGGIGDPAVRHMGTIGGSVANNDPAADYPAAVLGLGATVVTDRREIAADDFFEGMFATALDEAEVITAIRFPVPEKAAYAKFPNPASRYALVGVFVAVTGGKVRVAVTGASGDGVQLVSPLQDQLDGSFTAAAVDAAEVSEDGLMTDMHASAAYRAHLIKVMAKRAVIAAG
ncbi:MAG: xanthine dehydrogenase family protein subunit M [Pseudomonadota bacterium]